MKKPKPGITGKTRTGKGTTGNLDAMKRVSATKKFGFGKDGVKGDVDEFNTKPMVGKKKKGKGAGVSKSKGKLRANASSGVGFGQAEVLPANRITPSGLKMPRYG